MIFTDPNNPAQVASRNAVDISLSEITSSKVTIKISTGPAPNRLTLKASFQAEPYNGSLTIRLSDILRSLRLLPFGGLPNTGRMDNWEMLDVVSISAEAADETAPEPWKRRAFEGGYDPSMHSALVNSYWWTWRDQVCRTFRDGKELLGALFTTATATVSVRIVATFTDGTAGENILVVTASPGGDVFAVIDVSYSRVEAMFQKEIASYKVYRSGSQYPQVYEVSSLRPRRTFVFRNSLGMFDTVYALGRISDGGNRDVKTFIRSDRSEIVSDNNSRERIHVNSGSIDTKGELALWTEMLLSSEQVWEYNAGTYRQIVIDDFEMKLPQGVSGSVTFEYHYSEQPYGGFAKSEL